MHVWIYFISLLVFVLRTGRKDSGEEMFLPNKFSLGQRELSRERCRKKKTWTSKYLTNDIAGSGNHGFLRSLVGNTHQGVRVRWKLSNYTLLFRCKLDSFQRKLPIIKDGVVWPSFLTTTLLKGNFRKHHVCKLHTGMAFTAMQ